MGVCGTGRNRSNPCSNDEAVMNKDRIDGAKKQVVGNVKELAGKVLGDAKLQTDGKTQKIAGKIQNAAGGLEDSLKK
jgi:uncharacterized protein YjbJ (UPF0337 family)